VKEQDIYQFRPTLQIAKEPTYPRVRGSNIIHDHNATGFIGTIINYVQQFDKNLAFQLDEDAYFGVWSRFSLHHSYLPFAPLVGKCIDLVHASPARCNSHGRVTKQAFFDTMLLDDSPHLNGLLCE
jgi:hypothetical protein